MPDIEAVADHADVIVDGYAFTRQDDCVRVLNLNRPSSAAVFGKAGELWETSMDDIEIGIVHDYLLRSLKYMAV